MSALVVLFLAVGVTFGADLDYDIAEATKNGSAKLPCNLTPVHPPDKVSLVLWYRGDSESPFYRYDARSVRPLHWFEPTLGARYSMQVLDEEHANLTVAMVRLSDEDMYHCQVEFFRTPSRITHINLTVIGRDLSKNKRQVKLSTGSTTLA